MQRRQVAADCKTNPALIWRESSHVCPGVTTAYDVWSNSGRRIRACAGGTAPRSSPFGFSGSSPLGALSGARESWEYDSGARDLQSPDLQQHQQQPQHLQQQAAILQKLLEQPGSVLDHHPTLEKLLAQNSGGRSGGNYLELANTVSTSCHVFLLCCREGNSVGSVCGPLIYPARQPC